MSLDNLKTMAQQALGMTEKAKLYFHDVANVDKLDTSKVGDATAQVLANALNVLDMGGGTKEMTVQYNPSSLTIQANAKPIPFLYLQKNEESGAPNQNIRPPMVVLSVELIFDEMNPKDAFLLERTTLSADSVISTAAAIKKLTEGGYTVKPQTNGLVASILRPSTKTVTFRWGKEMSFTGQVMEVQARYTMFSPSGRPIRSSVYMNIAQQVESTADTKYWDTAVDRMFEEERLFGGGASQLAGNVLNLDVL